MAHEERPGACTAGGRARRAGPRCRRTGSGGRRASGRRARGPRRRSRRGHRRRSSPGVARRADRDRRGARRTAGSRARRGRRPAGSARSASPGARCSSSQRSFVASSGSKNAIGSAMWMTTGRPSSAAVAQSGSSRSSSTATSRPAGSRARSPSSFQTLSPRAPRATESRSRARLGLAERRVARPACVVEPGEHDEPVRVPRPASARPRATAPSPDPPSRSTSVSTPASSRRRQELAGRPTGPVAAERRPEVVVGVDDREPRPRTSWSGRAGRTRPVVGQPDHVRSRMTTWPRWRGASGSRPRTRARVSASAWPG